MGNSKLLFAIVTAGLVACSSSTSPTTAAEPSPTEPAPGTDSAAPPAREPATHTVTVTNFAYSPKTLTIKPGDTVQWVFEDGTHTVTSGKDCKEDGAFDSKVHGSPFTYTRTFDAAGSVPYFCSYREHCRMGQEGVIEVVP